MSAAIEAAAAEKDSVALVPNETAEAARDAIFWEIPVCPDDIPGDDSSEEAVEEPQAEAAEPLAVDLTAVTVRRANPNGLRGLRSGLRVDVKHVEATSGERAVVVGIVVPETVWWLELRPLLEGKVLYML